MSLPGIAAASVNVVEAESMQWGAKDGQIYTDPAASGGAAFQNWSNSWGAAAADLPIAPTGLKVRVRSGQRPLGSLACRGYPQVAVRIGTTTVLTASIPPSQTYSEPIVDVKGIPAGLQQIQVGLRNNDPNNPVFPCARWLYIDKITIVGSRLFSPASWRNTALAPGAALDADQSAVTRLMDQVAVHGSWVNTTEWSVPLYVASASQTRQNVQVEAHEAPQLAGDWTSVPLSTNAMGAPPADGYDDRDPLWLRLNKGAWTDRYLVLYQPATDTLWEFIHLVKRGGAFYAADGGKISNVSDSNGTWDPWPFPNPPHGTTGSGIPLAVGLQTINEVVKRGSIDHAVAMVVPHATDIDPSNPNPDTVGARPPAIRSDGDRLQSLYPDSIEEGTRFRLPASLDIDTLGLTPYGKILATAIQRYGAVVVDRDCAVGQTCTGDNPDSNAAVTFYAQQPADPLDNPYVNKFGSGFPYRALANFPWSQLQVLPPVTP